MFARDTLVFLKALAELFGRGLLILSTRRGKPCLPQQSLCTWLCVFPQGRDCVSEFVSFDGETWWGNHIPIAVPWSLQAEELAGRLVLHLPATLRLPFPRSAATPALRVPCQVCFVDPTLCTVLAEYHLGLHPGEELTRLTENDEELIVWGGEAHSSTEVEEDELLLPCKSAR